MNFEFMLTRCSASTEPTDVPTKPFYNLVKLLKTQESEFKIFSLKYVLNPCLWLSGQILCPLGNYAKCGPFLFHQSPITFFFFFLKTLHTENKIRQGYLSITILHFSSQSGSCYLNSSFLRKTLKNNNLYNHLE